MRRIRGSDRPTRCARRARWLAALAAATVLPLACTGTEAATSASDSTAPSTNPSSSTTPGALPSTSPPDAESDQPSGCVGELEGPETHRYREAADTPGVEADLVSLDVYRSVGASGCPVLVWVHGGGWTVGDKTGKAIDTKVGFAGELGASLVSVNYRLVGPDSEIRWPTMGQDVAAAVAWVADHADELGVDPERIALMGHSAGAHLAASLGTNPDLLGGFDMSRDDLRYVVTLDSAAYDITEADVRAKEFFEPAFGTDPAGLADASPTIQATEHPSGMPDFLVVTRGTRQRIAESRAFASALSEGGASAEVIDARGYTHEQVNTAVGEPTDDVVTPPVREFLDGCLGTG